MQSHFFKMLSQDSSLRQKVDAELLTSREGKQYYKLTLLPPKDQQGILLFINLQGLQYTVLHHHLSIYETRVKNEASSYETSYHYTADLLDPEKKRLKIHLHFSYQGRVTQCDLTLPKNEFLNFVAFVNPLIAEKITLLFEAEGKLIAEYNAFLTATVNELSQVDVTPLSKRELKTLLERTTQATADLTHWRSFCLDFSGRDHHQTAEDAEGFLMVSSSTTLATCIASKLNVLEKVIKDRLIVLSKKVPHPMGIIEDPTHVVDAETAPSTQTTDPHPSKTVLLSQNWDALQQLP